MKEKVDLVILGEVHNERQGKEMALALLKYSQSRGGYNNVIFAYEDYDRSPEALRNLLSWNNKLKDDMRGSSSKDLDALNAKISLYQYVLDREDDIKYLALEDYDIRDECYLYVKDSIDSQLKSMSPNNYYQGLIDLYEKRENFMVNTLADHLVQNCESRKTFILMLVGSDHAKNIESLFRERMQNENFDLNLINMPIGRNASLNPSDRYRKNNINHSVNGFLDVKKSDYKKFEDGIERIEILHEKRGYRVRESDERYLEKLELMFGNGSVVSYKKPSFLFCGSAEYVSVYPHQSLEQNPSSKPSEAEVSQIAVNNKQKESSVLMS